MADMIDISIKQVDKTVKPKDFEHFLNTELTIYEKLDGVKITLYLKGDASSTKSIDENWVVSYKGSILTSGEFEHSDGKSSIGSSQFKYIFDLLKNMNVDILPKSTQFFCEYLINKPTLMSSYSNLYNLILLSFGKSDFRLKNGKTIFNTKDFIYDEKEREKLALKMQIHTPPVIFKGKLHSFEEMKKGIKYKKLEDIILNLEDDFRNSENDFELYWKVVQNNFLSVESVFGGKPEGFVVYGWGKNPLKFQQTYQLSREERAKVRARYKHDSDFLEALYWTNVKKISEKIVKDSGVLDKKLNFGLENVLNIISKMVKKVKPSEIKHEKKNWDTIKDDIFLASKFYFVRNTSEKFALVTGKFRVFTKKHKELIDDALKKFDGVVINIVNNKSVEIIHRKLKREVIENCFSKEIKAEKIEVQDTITGNLITIMGKASNEIFGLFAGTDRVKEYERMINNYMRGKDIKVIEIPRDVENGISATKVIENIEDEKYFKKCTPKGVWKYYKKYKTLIEKGDI